MNRNIKIFSLCPVPENQKAINDYIQLKEKISTKHYKNSKQLDLTIAFFIFFVFLNIFNSNKENLFILFITFYLFILSKDLFIFLQWNNIYSNFTLPRLFYEEGSWYDGEIWEKPMFLIKNEKLLATKKIKPILTTFFSIKNFFFTLSYTFILIFCFKIYL